MSEQKQVIDRNSRPFRIIWDAHLKAHSLEEAETVLKQISEAIGHEITVHKCDYFSPKEQPQTTGYELTVHRPDQKDDVLFWVIFLVNLNTYELSTALMQSFQINRQIADKWEIDLSNQDVKDITWWSFSGKAIHPKIPAIDTIKFDVSNKGYSFDPIRREQVLNTGPVTKGQ